MRLLHAPTRREMLLGSGTLFAWAHLPRLAFAEGRDPRFLTIILRGALDGLATVAPVGDPDWVALRGDNALTPNGKAPPLKLDRLLCSQSRNAQSASPVQGRSGDHRSRLRHALSRTLAFRRPGRAGKRARQGDAERLRLAQSGAGGIASGGRVDPRGSAEASLKGGKAFAVGPVTPLVVRGPAPVLSWSPQRIQPASDDTVQRLLDLYRHTDVKLANAVDESVKLAAIEHAGDKAQKPVGPQPRAGARLFRRCRRRRREIPRAAGRTACRRTRPRRLGHPRQRGHRAGRLAQLLGALDGALAAIETNMGPAWRETVVVMVTEFGRTARINGTDGTDHGTATVALLAGGALKGGRVIADWPGLKPANLYENRDLKPTTDLRAVLKGVLKDHLRADERALADNVFPGSAGVKPMAGLVG